MPSFACGNRSCTAWASTCAVECRMTLRPSSVLPATGITSASASGTQLKSRSFPSASRTTTIASGAPRLGNPASPTAAAAVVPAGTLIGAAGVGCAAALIGLVLQGLGEVFDRGNAIGAGLQGPKPLTVPAFTRPASRLTGLEPHEQC